MAPKLLIIADDLTGALEAGEKLSELHIPVVVFPGMHIDYKLEIVKNREALIINSESRHISEQAAGRKIRRIVQHARQAGIKFFYKKTDSTLRGNIGAELKALMNATGNVSIPYIPAHPEQKRYTINGYQYLGKLKLHKTKFADDPLEPVKNSYIPQLLEEQTKVKIHRLYLKSPDNQLLKSPTKGIIVFDSKSVHDFDIICNYLNGYPDLTVLAGTAGFVSRLPGLFHLKKGRARSLKTGGTILFVNGSLNRISLEQVNFAKQKGIQTLSISDTLNIISKQGSRKVSKGIFKEIIDGMHKYKVVIITTTSPDSVKSDAKNKKRIKDQEKFRLISKWIGEIIKEVLITEKVNVLVVFGGDTLTGIIQSLRIDIIEPLGKIIPGVTLSLVTFGKNQLILVTKPGGYGVKNAIIEILKKIRN